MAQKSIGQYFKEDPAVAWGSLTLPIALVVFALIEKYLAENMQSHWISISQTFSAVVFSILALFLSLIVGMLVSPKITLRGWQRLFCGLGIGLMFSLLAVFVFYKMS